MQSNGDYMTEPSHPLERAKELIRKRGITLHQLSEIDAALAAIRKEVDEVTGVLAVLDSEVVHELPAKYPLLRRTQ